MQTLHILTQILKVLEFHIQRLLPFPCSLYLQCTGVPDLHGQDFWNVNSPPCIIDILNNVNLNTYTTSNSQQKSKGHEEYFNPNKRQEPFWSVIFVQGTGDHHVLSRYVIPQSEVFIEVTVTWLVKKFLPFCMALEHPLWSSQQSPSSVSYILNTSSQHIYFQSLSISFPHLSLAFPQGPLLLGATW